MTRWFAARSGRSGSALDRLDVAKRAIFVMFGDRQAERRREARASRAAPAGGSHHEPTGRGPAHGVDALSREIALIDDARANVVVAPARALASLELHRREFPRGQLGAERELLTVETLRRLNRIEEARQRAVALQVDYPSSSYAARAGHQLQSTP